MSLNSYRDEVKGFMQKAGFSGDSLEKLIGMLEEEFEVLKDGKDNPEVFKHQIYDMMYLLFSMAAKLEVNLDAEWNKGRERKKKYLPDSEKACTTYNKLVRDKIPEICENNGLIANVRALEDGEFEESLTAKLREECDEYIESRNLEELADVLEVIYAIIKYKKSDFKAVGKLRKAKVEQRGAFDRQLLLVDTKPRG